MNQRRDRALGHGEGSIYLADAILPGRTPAGKPIQRKVTGRTKTEVRGKLKWIQAEAEARLRTSASYTLAKAVADGAAEALDDLMCLGLLKVHAFGRASVAMIRSFRFSTCSLPAV